MRDEYIEAGAVKQGLGTGVLHGLNVSHGASYCAFVFGGPRDECQSLMEAQLHIDPASEPYVFAYMPCGSTVIIQTRDDFPSETLAAPCGHPEHFVVYYVAPS